MLSFRAYNRWWKVKQKYFLEVFQFEQQIGISEYFPGKFMNYQIFELSSSLVSLSDKKLGGVHNCSPPAPLHLAVN